MWGGLAVGPPLGAALAAAASLDAVWWACVIAPVVPALAVLTVREPGGDERRAPERGRRRAALLPRAAMRPGAALALASFGYGTLNAFLVLRFEQAGFGGAGVALGVFGGAFLLVRLLGSGLVDRWTARRLVAGSALIEAGGLALIALGPDAGFAVAGVVLCGAGTALVYPTLATLVANGTAPDRRGAAVGALTSSWDVGIALAGPAGGLLVAVAGLPAAFALAALAACAAAGAMVARPVGGAALLALER
jgi:predicted MFS family arabinose efflux permease